MARSLQHDEAALLARLSTLSAGGLDDNETEVRRSGYAHPASTHLTWELSEFRDSCATPTNNPVQGRADHEDATLDVKVSFFDRKQHLFEFSMDALDLTLY